MGIPSIAPAAQDAGDTSTQPGSVPRAMPSRSRPGPGEAMPISGATAPASNSPTSAGRITPVDPGGVDLSFFVKDSYV